MRKLTLINSCIFFCLSIFFVFSACKKNSSDLLSFTGFTPSIIGVGYPLTINGTNFSSDSTQNIVTVNGVAAKLVSSSPTKLVVIVPLTATTGRIVVTNNAQSATSATDIKIKTLTVTTIAGNYSNRFSDGTGTNANFFGPWNIIGDGNGNYYVTDGGNERIRKVTSDGVVTTFAGTGRSENKDGPIASANFASPRGIAFDKSGNLLVSASETIRKISTTGFVSTIAGSVSSGYKDGTGTNAFFYNPVFITTDKNDNIFVVDVYNNRVRKITPAGVVTTFAGNGTGGSDDGTGTAASFKFLQGGSICIDDNDNLYVADAGNHKIRKITPAGVVTTFAGTGVRGSMDGAGLYASFNLPMGLVRDAAGNFYVSDLLNYKIRMITPEGMVVTLAGNGIQETKDGVGGFASFASPLGMTIDPNGMIFMIDNHSAKVRKMIIQ